MRSITTRVEIECPADVVWRLLTDFASYPTWNPFIPRAVGEARVGATIDIDIKTEGRPAQPYRVRITRLDEGRAFGWLGHFHVRGLIDGDHHFELTPLAPGRVELVQREDFRGLLVPFVWRGFLDTHLRAGFVALNQALKVTAERGGRP